MKKLLIVLMLIMAIASYGLDFVADYFHEKVIVVCFEKSSVNNNEGILDFDLSNGIVRTGLSSFDVLAEQYGFVNLEQFIGPVKDLDWNENGVYIQNIYRVFLEDNANIEAAQTALSKDSNIIYSEYETINRQYYTPSDPLFNVQWHLPQTYCPEAWDYTAGSEEIIVGIVDSGIKWNHPDLQDNIWINEAELNAGMSINWNNGTVSGGNGIDEDGNGRADDVIGYNFYGQDNNASYQGYSANDHGTHVAGCAGAVGDNELGVSGASMVVKLISSRHAPTNQNYPYVQDGYSGIMYCADSGADVINCSWGGPGSGTTPNNVINYATSQGALVVCAAGNDNTEHTDSYQDYPSDCDNAVCVAATAPGDVKSYFSDYGEPIDVSCPGENIRSTIISANGYASYQGTSMASPIVAGIAALVKSVHPSIAPLDLKSRIMNTTDYIDDVNQEYAGLLGTGRVNAFQAAMYDLIPKLTIDNYDFYELIGDGDGVPNPGETLNFEVMLTNEFFSGGGWAAASDVEATLSCDMPGVEIVNGEVTFPDIPQFGFGSIEGIPFQISTPTDFSEYEIPVTVSITANPDAEYPYIVHHEVILPLSLTQAGWPFELGGTTSSSALIIDINEDEQKELIFGDHTGILHAVNPDGSGEIAGFPVTLSGNISAAVAIADLDDDGHREIVVGTEGNFIYAVSRTGEILFTYDAGGSIKGNPMIADVDNNGTQEIIVCTFTGPKAIVLNPDGTDYPGFPVTLPVSVLSSPAVADLNNDGYPEIITVVMSGNMHAISTNTGEDIAGFPYALGGTSWNGPIVANIDDDNEPEVVVATLTGKLVGVNHDGTQNFEKTGLGQVKGSVIVGDLDGNESVEIIFANANGDLYVTDTAGNDLANFPMNIGAGTEATPILANMNNSGSVDIVIGDNDGLLHSIDLNGVETANFPVPLGSTIKASATFGDIDGDGDLEIAVPNQSSYILVDYKNTTGSRLWECFKKNTSRTGVASQYITSAPNNEVPVFTTKLGNNYPNPFNPSTTVSFSVKESGNAKLEIYNVKGQLIKTLLNDTVSQGYHAVTWNGTDDKGQNVSSGLYLYKLTAKNYKSMKKMIMVK